jgi:hypothetical protein
MKFLNLYPDTKEAIMDVFSKYSTSAQLELQQRACEYMQMPNIGAETMEQVHILCNAHLVCCNIVLCMCMDVICDIYNE